MAQETLRWGSFVLLSLTLASWVIVLGGVASLNWLTCSDAQATKTSIAETEGTGASAVYAQFWVTASTDVATCSRRFRWEWWTLFFEFAILCYGLASTLLPNRLPRARYAVAQYLVIATVLIMIALNANITDVWFFWDQNKLFSNWSGVAQKMYLSSAAVVAGWILTAIFNFIYIGFSLDYEVAAPKPAAQVDVEAPQAPKK